MKPKNKTYRSAKSFRNLGKVKIYFQNYLYKILQNNNEK